MDLFANAKEVRLRSHHDKYLIAEEDEEGVIQDRNASSRSARWSVEFVPSSPHRIRLKSRYGKYLTASDEAHFLGMTGRKVVQTIGRRGGGSAACVEWEPIRDGKRVKLRSCSGKDFLRANGGLPPWRNSVTHDVPHRTSTQEWVLWDVDVVDILETPYKAAPPAANPAPPLRQDSASPSPRRQDSASPSPRRQDSASPSPRYDYDYEDSSSPAHTHKNQEMWQSSDSMDNMRARTDGRVIYYHIAEEDGSVNEEEGQGYPLTFKGNSVEELTGRLREDTGMEDIIVCTRSPLNAKLYPLRLHLPPNTVSMHVVVVPSAMLAAF